MRDFSSYIASSVLQQSCFKGRNMQGFVSRLFTSAFAWLLLSLCINTHAFEISTGENVQCEVNLNGKTGVATEIWDRYTDVKYRSPELGRAVAVMRLDDSGWPTIIFDAPAHEKSIKGSQTIWDFVYFHECAHAQNPKLSEVGANCSAYIEMGKRGLMNYNRMKQLETMHFNMMSILPIEYAGSGSQFWHQTLKCVKNPEEYFDSIMIPQ